VSKSCSSEVSFDTVNTMTESCTDDSDKGYIDGPMVGQRKGSGCVKSQTYPGSTATKYE